MDFLNGSANFLCIFNANNVIEMHYRNSWGKRQKVFILLSKWVIIDGDFGMSFYVKSRNAMTEFLLSG